jgi:hypothetical protein
VKQLLDILVDVSDREFNALIASNDNTPEIAEAA